MFSAPARRSFSIQRRQGDSLGLLLPDAIRPAVHKGRKFFSIAPLLTALTLGLLLLSGSLHAQPYQNEWIRHNQPYFKFKVGANGLYRIPKSTLDAAGIGDTQVQFFELWRNGQRVPFHATVASGPLGSGGYIEFWGEPNDGKPDRELYRNPAFQHTTAVSLLTDTAVYFLSVNTDQSGLRYQDPGNDVTGSSLPVEPYYIHRQGHYFRNRMNLGYASVVGEYVYSSSFDKGEFWSSQQIRPATPLTTNLTNIDPYPGGPDPVFRFGAMGDAENARRLRVLINNNLVVDTVMDLFVDVHTSLAVPAATVGSGTVPFRFENSSNVSSDRLVISYFELDYPRAFNFRNQKQFSFSLPASGVGYLLHITNFNYGSQAPVLLDLTHGQRIVGDISTPGIVKVVLPPGGARDLVLVNVEASNAQTVNSLTPKTFRNFSDPANQGDYLIISHPVLYQGSNGNNPVEDYRAYRSSPQGGGYQATIVEIDELIDQFAYGIKKSPLAIRNFLRFARAQFSDSPKFVFIIGRGMAYSDFRVREGVAEAQALNLVPTFGAPGSDNLLSSPSLNNPVPQTPIGRLSVVRGSEVEDYLNKVKTYEAVQANAAHNLEERGWMKNILHVTGSSDPYLGTTLCNFMSAYRQVIEDTLYGGKVSMFCKSSAAGSAQFNADAIAQLFKTGLGMLTYFGHSSTTTLEFNLDNPQNYDNTGKYPIFFVNGCNAGNFFTYNTARLQANETLSEKFTLAPEKGCIAFVASTHYGIVNYLNLYLNQLYQTLSKDAFGASLGEVMATALTKLLANTGPQDYFGRLHAEQMTIHGDPALHVNGQEKPDYAIEEPEIRLNPTFISVAEGSFNVSVRITNLGRAVGDSLKVRIVQQYPDGSSATIFEKLIRPVRNTDSIILQIPIVATRDKGQNRLTVTLNPDNDIDEVTTQNNMAEKVFFIYEDEARPVYPYPFAIIKDPTHKLYASTADPLTAPRQYTLQLDTTATFDSPFLITKTLTSSGGLLEFDPGVAYTDNTVYYWRVAPGTPEGEQVNWSNSSFRYEQGDHEGFSQGHYFQHLASATDRISLGPDRRWKYGVSVNHLFIRNGVYPYGGSGDSDYSVEVNGSVPIASACLGTSLVFNVFDSVTFKPWKNVDGSGNNLFSSGSASANCSPNRNYNFEFSYQNATARENMVRFMDSIPEGSYVIVRNIPNSGVDNNRYVNEWMADTAIYGSNRSIYHKLLEAGFLAVDSFYRPRSFIFLYKKGSAEFSPRYVVSEGIFDRITLTAECETPDSLGYITSPVFGPARAWQEVIWEGSSTDTASGDRSTVEVIGIQPGGQEVVLYTLDHDTRQLDISAVDAGTYPRMRLRMRNGDSLQLTPYQLQEWKLYYEPVPEGAIATNLHFVLRDSMDAGEQTMLEIPFKNISRHVFDSVAVHMYVRHPNNAIRTIEIPRTKPLQPGDTATLRYVFQPEDLVSGANTVFVEFNPDKDQPEQHQFNNFLFKEVSVRTDRENPFLDVTFDGIHIINRDIVSAKPHIQIRLKDESKYLLLDDTSVYRVQVRYPDGTVRTFHFDQDTLRFTPATSSTDNSALVDFFPDFSDPAAAGDGEYELIVMGKDKSGNKAGNTEFRIAFTVISKPMISNLLNYPNPFSTSTAFVFTLTGSEIPQNLKIQILTVTGKIVREITKDELGPIRIGRNITEFKWDGTDQFGQKLANGVYLYRFVATLHGSRMEKYKAKNDNTDVFFNNGYGKMYLMR